MRPVANVADISPCTAEAQGDVARITFRPGSHMSGLTFGNREDDDLLRAILARTFTQVLAQSGSKNVQRILGTSGEVSGLSEHDADEGDEVRLPGYSHKARNF